MFVGIFTFGSRTQRALGTPAQHLKDALNPFGQADVVGSWRGERAQVVQTLVWNTPESRYEEVPWTCPDTGRVVAGWVRLDNRYELLQKLAIDRRRRDRTTDPMLLLAAFNKWGESCTEHLLGDFSFAICDPLKRTVFVARDPLGVKPLYYHVDDGLVIVSTTAAAFHVIDGLLLTPSEEWMALYTLQLSMSHVDTAWPQVKKLPGGHQLTFDESQPPTRSAAPRRYFEFHDDAPPARIRSDHRVDAYRSVLEESVRCRLRTDFALGSETSGGIDSSTCLGFAAELWEGSKDDLHAFGFVHTEDEPDYILETSRMHGITNNKIHDEFKATELDERLDRTLRVLGYPHEHGNSIGHEPFYQDCESLGVRTLFSGFGGDEVVTNPGHLLRRELIDGRRFGMLVSDIHGPVALRPLRLARSLQRDRRGTRVPSHLRASADERWTHYSVRTDVVDRYSLKDRYDDRNTYDEGYRSINSFILGNRLGASFVPTRLENCTLMAQARKVDYRWPLLDVRLVQQYLSTPSIEKKARAMGRYLHRRAIEGVVPESVQWKVSKYMGEPLERGRSANFSELAETLREDLHPLVNATIDSTKLLAEVDALNTESGAGDVARTFAVSRQLNCVSGLDYWLKRYHP